MGNFDHILRGGRGEKEKERQEMGSCFFRKFLNLIKVPGEKINTYWNVEPSDDLNNNS